jgi:hypothetical protein
MLIHKKGQGDDPFAEIREFLDRQVIAAVTSYAEESGMTGYEVLNRLAAFSCRRSERR